MRSLKFLARLNQRCAGRKRTVIRRAAARILGPLTAMSIKGAVRVLSSRRPDTRSISNQVERLGVDGLDDTQVIERLCGYVNRNIQYVSMDRWLRPEDVLRFGIGDCKNQALLLEKMLEEAGLSSKIVVGLINRDSDRPSIHAWVDVSGKEGRHIVDPTVSGQAHTDDEYRDQIRGYIDVTPEYQRKLKVVGNKSCVGIIETGGD